MNNPLKSTLPGAHGQFLLNLCPVSSVQSQFCDRKASTVHSTVLQDTRRALVPCRNFGTTYLCPYPMNDPKNKDLFIHSGYREGRGECIMILFLFSEGHQNENGSRKQRHGDSTCRGAR